MGESVQPPPLKGQGQHFLLGNQAGTFSLEEQVHSSYRGCSEPMF